MDEMGSKNEDNFPSAGAVPPRDFMITTAVHFLQNPKVQSSPLSQKRAFLIKKGLTYEEIDAAIEKASASAVPLPQGQIVPNNHQIYRLSLWSRINRYGSAIIIVGIVLYGLQQFYKLYIEPLLYGAKKRDGRLSQMEEQLLELSRSLSHLRKSVSSIEETLDAQKEELQRYLADKCVQMEQAFNPTLLLQLKSDVSTVKSLLLNRRQFPDVPKVAPCIPSWQLIGIDRKNERLLEKEEENCDEITDLQSPSQQMVEREFHEETEDQTTQKTGTDETKPTPTWAGICGGGGGVFESQEPAST